MGTRFTTQRSPHGLGELLHRVLLEPAVWAAIAAVAGAAWLGWPRVLVLSAGLVAGAVAGGLRLEALHLSIPARLRRAMVEAGLCSRDRSGRLQEPRLRGRPVRVGRNARLRWKLPPGVTLSDVLARQAAIEGRCDCALNCWEERGSLVMDVLRHPIPEHVLFSDFYAGPRPHGQLLLGLGMGRRGALWVDLDSCPHLLVGGMTGGGKSVFLRQACTFLSTEYSPSQLRLCLLDLKGGTELAQFSYLPHAMAPVADNVLAAADLLTKVRRELDRRLGEVRRSVEADGSAARQDWPRIVVVVDEVAELTVRDLGDDRAARAAQQAATGRLAEIARLGRAVGVHLVCCTQRPDAEAVPGQLKANLSGTVAFRVRAALNSWILLDSERAALLPPHPGRGLWSHETVEEFQAIDCSMDESRSRLLARWGSRPDPATTGPVTPWWQNTDLISNDPEEQGS
ncbi:MAG TPA: FtsK/SpoIIIE domain-containing protein [Candidatus Dormibacteraeota bacterium]|nr:FtsK/SpoIIIE domain-containing protein [Candidatus Dormibacteraeota bacterium]